MTGEEIYLYLMICLTFDGSSSELVPLPQPGAFLSMLLGQAEVIQKGLAWRQVSPLHVSVSAAPLC